jgi:hypothetical protein
MLFLRLKKKARLWLSAAALMISSVRAEVNAVNEDVVSCKLFLYALVNRFNLLLRKETGADPSLVGSYTLWALT